MFAQKKLGAVPVYLLLIGGGSFFSTLVFTVNLIYQVQIAHLNPLQLVLVGTILEGTAFLFEVPTGIVADVYSRRLSIIIGAFLLGIGLALQGVVPRFGVILLAQVIWGIGSTFMSGATEAWLTDEIGVERANPLFLRASQFELIGSIIAVAIATAIGNFSLQAPILIGGGLYLVMGVVLLVVMPEHGFTPTPRAERTTWQVMGGQLKSSVSLVRRSHVLLTIFGIMAFSGAASESYDRLSTDHFLTNFAFPTFAEWKPVVWLGIVSIIGRLVNIGAFEVVRRRLDTNSHRAVARALTISTALLVVCYLGFALAGNLALAAIASTGVWMFRRINNPLQTAWINQHVDSSVRATVISISNQADAIGQIAGGPVVGYVGVLASVRAALVVGGGILTPALLLYAQTLRRADPLIIAVEESALP
ncbi:MAG: MFS transporter [Chloroflexota bacterium]|nr:MFS transporter [Chloroflexota bacterium]